MKKILFLLIFNVLSTVSFAQYYSLDSVVHTVKGIQFIASQKYDRASKKAEIIRYERANAADVIQKKERTQVTYNDNGSELYYVFSVWNPESKSWSEEEKTENEFNVNNKLTSVLKYNKINAEWVKDTESRKIYAKNSITEIDYEKINSQLLPFHKSITVFNSFDKVKTHEIFLWSNENQHWEQLNRTENYYLQDTILISSESFSWKKNEWKKQEKIVYELNAKELKTNNYMMFGEFNNSWIPIRKFEEKELPEQNKKISSSYKWEAIQNKWIIQTQTETFYNKEGKEQDVLFLEWDTSTHQLKLQLEQINLYDDEGRLKLVQEFDHSSEKTVGTQTTIKLDKEGNIIQKNIYEYDADYDSWIDKMTIEVTYNNNILLDTTLKTNKKSDLFSLNDYNEMSNKYTVKQVRIYEYISGKKVLQEEFDYFYLISK